VTTSRARIGLVLGGGGLVGQAYHAGVLAALEHDLHWDPRDADTIVGTSAGALTGVLLRSGVPASELAAWLVEAEVSARTRSLLAGIDRDVVFDPLQWTTFLRPGLPGLGLLNWPRSLLAWDVIVLNGYLALNVAIPFHILFSHFSGRTPHKRSYLPWIYLAVIWAVSIHLVTAFLLAGLPARPFWNNALLGPRFLASAFTAGPASATTISCAGFSGMRSIEATPPMGKSVTSGVRMP